MRRDLTLVRFALHAFSAVVAVSACGAQVVAQSAPIATQIAPIVAPLPAPAQRPAAVSAPGKAAVPARGKTAVAGPAKTGLAAAKIGPQRKRAALPANAVRSSLGVTPPTACKPGRPCLAAKPVARPAGAATKVTKPKIARRA